MTTTTIRMVANTTSRAINPPRATPHLSLERRIGRTLLLDDNTSSEQRPAQRGTYGCLTNSYTVPGSATATKLADGVCRLHEASGSNSSSCGGMAGRLTGCAAGKQCWCGAAGAAGVFHRVSDGLRHGAGDGGLHRGKRRGLPGRLSGSQTNILPTMSTTGDKSASVCGVYSSLPTSGANSSTDTSSSWSTCVSHGFYNSRVNGRGNGADHSISDGVVELNCRIGNDGSGHRLSVGVRGVGRCLDGGCAVGRSVGARSRMCKHRAGGCNVGRSRVHVCYVSRNVGGGSGGSSGLGLLTAPVVACAAAPVAVALHVRVKKSTHRPVVRLPPELLPHLDPQVDKRTEQPHLNNKMVLT